MFLQSRKYVPGYLSRIQRSGTNLGRSKWPVGLAEFNWVELFTFEWLMDEIRVLQRWFPKAGKTKPNMPDSTSRLVESLVANHLKKEKFLMSHLNGGAGPADGRGTRSCPAWDTAHASPATIRRCNAHQHSEPCCRWYVRHSSRMTCNNQTVQCASTIRRCNAHQHSEPCRLFRSDSFVCKNSDGAMRIKIQTRAAYSDPTL